MKRIASSLLSLSMVFFVQCSNNPVDPEPEPGPNPEGKNVSLKIYVPKSNISTYAGVDATPLENRIDTLYVDLYQNNTTLKQDTFPRSKLDVAIGSNDSIVTVGYEVDNITSPNGLRVEVFANSKTVKVLSSPTDSIPLPKQNDPKTSFFMSGEAYLAYQDGSYRGEVHVIRNVAKVRVNVSKHSVILPSDLDIEYDKIEITTINIADRTSVFGPGTDVTNTYASTDSRTGTFLHKSPAFSATDGGQIDSFYVYENIRNDFSTYPTKVEVSITTTSPTTGTKTDTYTYSLYVDGTYNIHRNYIYTLDIKVRGQSLEPVVTTSIQPWDDVNINGTIHGTYLTMDQSEILFDANGEATINFCSDAQAIYFNFTDFNDANPHAKMGFEITHTGIDEDTNDNLAPDGFKDGQILLDKQHCGSFGFNLDLDEFPEFPNVSFSGKICVRAGNIVKCLSFPGIRTYDAHFIVGDTLFVQGEKYTSATVSNGGSWLHVSENRLYNAGNMKSNYSGTAIPLYLHLDENLTGSLRTGSVTVITEGGAEKTIHISQLPAIPVGRFGYTSTTTDDSIYTAMLYTEQLYEFTTMPTYSSSTGTTLNNAIYNGRMSATSVFDWTIYSNNANPFDYQNTLYQAINYCAHKNRITVNNALDTELKWYLPSQAQLLGMWLSHNSYKDITTSNFHKDIVAQNITRSDIDTIPFWSSTENKLYTNEAQLINFKFGNVGHHLRSDKGWVRCVRDGAVPTTSMITGGNVPIIDFGNGMPAGSYTTTGKVNGAGDENSVNNSTLFKTLRVAVSDLSSLGVWNLTACAQYSEGGVTNWRLPTQRELQAIWILQHEIKSAVSGFNLLSDDYYWSATESSVTNTHAWTIFGSGSRNDAGGSGNAPIQQKSQLFRIRCVSEQ